MVKVDEEVEVEALETGGDKTGGVSGADDEAAGQCVRNVRTRVSKLAVADRVALKRFIDTNKQRTELSDTKGMKLPQQCDDRSGGRSRGKFDLLRWRN
jgi:hypothetical protein